MTRRTLTAAVTAVLIGAGAATSTAVAPPAVQCGDVIEGDVALTADLVCPDSPVGLVLSVGATLDLGGHSVVGGGDTAESLHGAGIQVPVEGGATVRNGAVEGWAVGVAVEQTDDAGPPQGPVLLDRLALRANRTGLSSSGFIQPTPEFVITASEFVENEAGIGTWQAQHMFLRSSRIVGNVTGVDQSEGGSGMTLVDCEVADNGTGLGGYDGGYSVVDSVLRDNGTALSSSGSIENSVIERNRVGVRGGFDGWVGLYGNVLRDNATAVRLSDTFGAIADNTFIGNDVAFTATGDYGVATLERNEFHANGDAILAVGVGSILDSNTAVDNARWGIHAPGAVDLGGNQAWGNGNEPQCVGVVCGTSGPVS